MFIENVKMQKVCVMGRFRGRVTVRGENIQFVQYKNHYVYGKSP